MAKRAGRVGSKQVTGQNGSFLNGSIGLRVKRVAGQTGLTRFVMSNGNTHVLTFNVIDNPGYVDLE